MIKTLFTTFATLSMGALSLQARLGEDSTECEARYGKGQELPLSLSDDLKIPEGTEWTAKSYSARGLTIQVVYDNDVAVFIRYANESPFKLAKSAPPSLNLTAPEISYLRKINLGEATDWKPYRETFLSSVAPTTTLWKSSDEARYAGYDRQRKILFVCSAAFWNTVVGKIKENSGHEGPSERFEGL